MDHNNSDLNKISELFTLAADGEINDEQFKALKTVLKNNKTVRWHYYRLVNIEVLLRDCKGAYEENQELKPDMEFWQEMAEYEKAAPLIEIPTEKPRKELIQKVIYPPREKRKISMFSKVLLAMNVAAILFILLFLKFAPAKPIEVATLSDSMNAKWADADSSMRKGARLVNSSEKLMLREGMAELTFDNETKAVIEAPAEFEILADDRIGLTYGKVYAIVPPDAVGFSVYTPNAKIIDMGTEFGIQADFHGNTQLSVLKGKILLATGGADKTKMEVSEGIAKKISGETGEISDAGFQSNYFVRDINSESNRIWRGNNLSLTSIAAGLDGFQEVRSLVGLDPVTGEYVTSVTQLWRRSNKTYNRTPGLKFIDGIFVPDGETGAIQVTSSGHTFDCPDTLGEFTHDIAAYKGSVKKQQTSIPPVIINGQEVVNDPVLVLHSNVGITFDLQAIRESLPQLNLKCLKATGVPTQESKPNPNLDFWILVDGQIRHERKILTIDSDRGPIPFDVEFNPEDRFLTLIVTDGLDDKFANDFFYLIKPELCLTDDSVK